MSSIYPACTQTWNLSVEEVLYYFDGSREWSEEAPGCRATTKNVPHERTFWSSMTRSEDASDSVGTEKLLHIAP